MIELNKKLGISNEHAELLIIKEYLYGEIDKINKEIEEQAKDAEKKDIAGYVISIFTKKLKERILFLKHLLDSIVLDIDNLEK